MNIEVPANSSRYFNSAYEAREEQSAQINYVIHNEGYLYNEKYNPSLVKYDATYSTVNKFQLKNSIESFERICQEIKYRRYIEIGCGQGEFTDYLVSKGIEALGFDPVCRVKKSYLVNDFFNLKYVTPGNLDIVFVMRCVLPHISEPFRFLDSIFEKFPTAMVLMQHQRLDFFANTRSWNSIMHDHVNLFGDHDFENRYKVYSSTQFADNEWQQILISKKTRKSAPSSFTNDKSLRILLDAREKDLIALKNEKNLYIFGAAGKGINFAFACVKSGIHIIAALDDHEEIWGKYLEGSGVKVLSPDKLNRKTELGTLVVMNPNHLESVKNRFSSNFRICSLMNLYS